MKEQIEIQSVIRSHFDAIKIKNSSFSLRAYAKKLNLAPSALSEILNGKRKISKKLATRILERLNLSPEESIPLLGLFDEKTKNLDFHGAPLKPVLNEPSKIDFLQLSSDQFNLIGEWQHFALLSLIETKGFKSDVTWIAQRLCISTQLVQVTLDRLIRLGFVFKKNKKFVTNKKALISSDNIPNQAVRKSHYADLQLAEKALDNCPVDQRDFTAITVAANSKQLARAKQMIRTFQDELTLCLEEGSPDEVFKFTFYLYPLSTGKKEEI